MKRPTLSACESEPLGLIHRFALRGIATASLASVRVLNAFLAPPPAEAAEADGRDSASAETDGQTNGPSSAADAADAADDESAGGGDAAQDRG